MLSIPEKIHYLFYQGLKSIAHRAIQKGCAKMEKTMMFPNQTCKEIVERACAEAVKVCVTFNADIDRALCVQIVDEMLRSLAKAQGASLEKDRARLLAEMQVGSFNTYRLPKLAAFPGGKVLYAKAKWSLVERLGREACASLYMRVA